MELARENKLKSAGGWTASLDLDAGVYKDVAANGMNLSQYLELQRQEKKGEQSPYVGLSKYEIMQYRKAMKAANLHFPLTALEEALKILGIQITGTYADRVSKFYETSGGDVLFPEVWADIVHSALMLESILPKISMGETIVDSDNYHKLYLETVEQDKQLRKVGEYEQFPEIKIKVADQSVTIQMFGAYVTQSYSAMKHQRMDVFAKALQQIAMQIEIDRCDDAVRTLRLGDGNSNTPGTTVSTTTTGTIAIKDVIAWATGLPTPYKMDYSVGKKALYQEYLETLADMNNPSDQFGFMGIQLPQFLEWDRTSIPTDNFIGVDSRYALQHITNGAVLVESEKVIRCAYEGVAISHGDCFSVFDKNAVAIFDETH